MSELSVYSHSSILKDFIWCLCQKSHNWVSIKVKQSFLLSRQASPVACNHDTKLCFGNSQKANGK